MASYFITLFCIWRLRYRLWKLQRRYAGERWVVSLPLLLEIAAITDPVLLKHYVPRIGGNIEVICGFDNIHDILKWLERMAQLVAAQGYLTNADSKPMLNRRRTTLNDLLVDDQGNPLYPIPVLTHLTDRISELDRNLRETTNPHFKDYYTRRLTGMFQDIAAVMEGLLEAAMYDEKKYQQRG